MTGTLDETTARAAVLVQAFDAAPGPQWTTEDRAWATRLAAETAGADADASRFIAERAHHALQRLAPRDAGVARWLARRTWRPLWLLAAIGGGLVLGILVDTFAGRQRIDLLAAPVWAVIAWNLLVYLGLGVAALRPTHHGATGLSRWAGLGGIGLRPWINRLWLSGERVAGTAPLQSASAAWLRLSAPLSTARVALLLHVASAALALGLIAGLYLRGLVLDYRAGWQSTFLDAATVRALLSWLLAPAVAVTGIGVPDALAMQALRLTPAAPSAMATAAPWIHLYAAMLGLCVVLPRCLLAGAAAFQARRLVRRFPLPLDSVYFQQLLRRRRGGVPRVHVWAHAAAPGAQAALGLRALLARALGEEVQLTLAPVTPFGDEERMVQGVPAADLALRVVLVDLSATPEGQAQGRLLQALQASAAQPPLLLVADEAAFRRRFAGLPERLAERRRAWQKLADLQGVALLCVDLGAPDLAAAESSLQTLLAR